MNTKIDNPLIDMPDSDYMIMFKQNKETMIDADIYERFIYSVTSLFYKSRMYRDYKNYVMNLGMIKDSLMANINSEQCSIELHHVLPTLKQATIMITEHLINIQGYANTFEVLQLLEEAHRNHEIAITMLSKTMHQAVHASVASFISLSQCWGRPDKFIEKYIDGMTFDISMKFLLAIKQEYQYNGESNTPMMAKVRDEILDWQVLNGYRTQTGGIFVPFNQNYNTQQYGYGYPQQQLIFF